MLTSKVNRVAKVVICGMKGVGKTTILEQMIKGDVDLEIQSTIEDIYVASVDCGRGTRDTLRIYDTAGLQGNAQLPRHYLTIPDGFILVYDPSDSISLDMLAGIKNDIDKNKEKKEICIIVIANMQSKSQRINTPNTTPTRLAINLEVIESNLNRANNWCARERIKHYQCNAMERASLYEPFINLTSKLHPPQAKSSFPQFKQLTQKNSRADS